ncbi:MAG: GNAT family N-acetyltransferase [Bdellovibrionota bacterium]
MNFALPQSLSSNLLILRPIILNDFEELYNIASDPQIWDQHPFPRYERSSFTEFFDQAIESKVALIVLDRKTNTIIGSSRYYDVQENRLSIGYTFLARSYWGGKFNRELKTLMLEHAFRSVSEVFFDIGESNFRSRRAIEKIGAKLVKFQMNKGKPYTLYAINEDAFRVTLKESR